MEAKNTMQELYTLTNEAKIVKNMMYDDEVDDQFIIDTIDSMQVPATEIIENVACLDRELKYDIDRLDAEIEFMKIKKQVLQRRKDRFKEYTREMMESLNMSSCKVGVFNVSIVTNGGLQPMEVDETNVPDEYMKVIYEIDKKKIREDLESGKKLSFASLKERTKSLRIK